MSKSEEKKEKSALRLIERISTQIEGATPTKREMLDDVKMMGFKIRPLSGDIFALEGKNFGFLESLWRLAKIEELIGDEVDQLENQEKEIFLRYLDNLQQKTQDRVSTAIKSLPEKERRNLKVLELEVFREKDRNKKN